MAKTTTVYQWKVTLNDIKPAIWRRVQVKSDLTLGKLHFVLQDALGWTNSHLHHFQIRGERYGMKDVTNSTATSSTNTVTNRVSSSMRSSTLNTSMTSAWIGGPFDPSTSISMKPTVESTRRAGSTTGSKPELNPRAHLY